MHNISSYLELQFVRRVKRWKKWSSWLSQAKLTFTVPKSNMLNPKNGVWAVLIVMSSHEQPGWSFSILNDEQMVATRWGWFATTSEIWSTFTKKDLFNPTGFLHWQRMKPKNGDLEDDVPLQRDTFSASMLVFAGEKSETCQVYNCSISCSQNSWYKLLYGDYVISHEIRIHVNRALNLVIFVVVTSFRRSQWHQKWSSKPPLNPFLWPVRVELVYFFQWKKPPSGALCLVFWNTTLSFF